jgi:hypothetical protein
VRASTQCFIKNGPVNAVACLLDARSRLHPARPLARPHPCTLHAPARPQTNYTDKWERRDILGIHAQKQPGMFFAGVCVPAGRIHTDVGALFRV